MNFDIEIEAKSISMRISDNGVGYDSASSIRKNKARPQYGIANMHERARSSGGRLTIESSAVAGTVVPAI